MVRGVGFSVIIGTTDEDTKFGGGGAVHDMRGREIGEVADVDAVGEEVEVEKIAGEIGVGALEVDGDGWEATSRWSVGSGDNDSFE